MTTQPLKRLEGLDSIRFVLASFVVLGHFGPHVDGDTMNTGLVRYLRLLINNAFNGPAAVIAFFVVSGLCIHYPNRDRRTLPLLPFYMRREVRILIPVTVVLVLTRVIGVPMHVFQGSILWSLICEEFYYLLYPALLRLFHRVGVLPVLVVSFVLSYVVIVLHGAGEGDYPSFGIALNWLVGLPCWLLGCLVAERHRSPAGAGLTTSTARVVSLRLGVFAASIGFSILRFHSPLTYPWTLNVFAVLCFFWLREEIAYFETHRASALLERFGLGSYSLYLVHGNAFVLWNHFGISNKTFLYLPFIYAVCWVFYRLVEGPSHRLARSVNASLTRSRAADLPVAAPSALGD